MDYEELYELIQVAKGDIPAEFVLKNAEIVNVLNGAFDTADIAIHKGIIAGIGRYKGMYERDLQRSIVAPGFIDAHMHIETSMLRPEALSVELIKHGTTTAIADPHEIANIAGLTGVNYLLKATRDVPIDFFFTAPSSVPSTPAEIETTGASITRDDISMLLSNPAFIGLSEVMDIAGIMSGRPETLEKILAAAADPIDGHAPQLKGKRLNAYLVAGPTTDHESTELNEALTKIARGMFLMIRESSVAKNLDALLPAVNYFAARRMCVVTDDRSLTDIIEEGHVDHIIRKAISRGIDIRLALQMATLNPSQHYGLHDRGAVAPGRIADLIILEDLTEVYIRTVIKNGVVIYDIGQDLQFIETYTPPITLKNSIFADKVEPRDFALPSSGKQIRAIKVIPNEIVTEEAVIPTPALADMVTADRNRDIIKIAVINRYNRQVKLSLGLLQGFGLSRGALASSVSHDAHNIVVAGVNDEDMANAVNAVIDMQGGLVAVNDGAILATLQLRIAGLMSEGESDEVYDNLKAMQKIARDLGTQLSDPFMTLSFLTLATVPSLKITDKGLVNSTSGELVPLFL
ncbi:MAG TPA: adenine deaminase [Candidatus Aquicultor sp.]|jgi:adenine deaminase